MTGKQEQKKPEPSCQHGPDPMQDLADHLAAVSALLGHPAVRARIGGSLVRELGYPLASFRARFPDLLPGSQQTLPIPIEDMQ
ncbi:hypothetical protein LXM94_25495 [Rhizobium sp. TRM95111]|uniref:hypothetical protein n=1 Tax=Rhizobium alarense TaxID=2846851 RepID=UPI001F428A7F|nr:hypothetical protein [Rhizobium alarense]MCF3643312.1 hypothetical protein [Rhizobium alarense]